MNGHQTVLQQPAVPLLGLNCLVVFQNIFFYIPIPSLNSFQFHSNSR